MSDLYSRLLAPADADERFYGITVGIVTNNQDPQGLGRVQVRFPWLSDEHGSHWARVASPMAGKERGLYFLPEVDDEVLVAFEHGVVEFPYVLGALWNGKDLPPEPSDQQNNRRTIKSRSGHIIRLDDTDGDERIEIIDKSAKNSIVISTKDNSITITSDADLTVASTSGALTLSGKSIAIKSQEALKVEAGGNLDLKGGPQLNIKGQRVNIN
jgi:uncharacterized protein involved in type VI secretion and phage assembly